MTIQKQLAELPEMPNPYTGPDDMTINEFRVATIRAYRARLKLVLEVLAENVCDAKTCPICADRHAVLEAMKELR